MTEEGKKNISLARKKYFAQKQPENIFNKCKICSKLVRRKTNKYCSRICMRKDKDYINNVKNATKNGVLKKYGVEYNFQVPEIKEKRKQTWIKKYGVDHPWKNDKIQSKIKKTNIEKYGFEVTFKNKEVQNNYKKAYLKKYGVGNPFQNNDVIEKIKKINLEKYGAKHNWNSNSIVRKQLTQSNKGIHYKNLLERLINIAKPLFNINEYENSLTNYNWECIKCNNKFEDSIANGQVPRCPICFPNNRSFLELQVFEFIKNNYNDTIITNNRKILDNKFELDIFLPNKKLAFEFNGLYFHSESKKNKYYHLEKTRECEKRGIHLIHIWEDNWINNNELIKNKILNLLNLNQNRIFARKCNIVELNNDEKKIFLNKNHIQGDANSKIKFGAFYNNELVAIMTFGKLRLALGNKDNNDGEYELIRFATSKKVIGIGGKLLKHFVKLYQPKKIISYADRCWTTEIKENIYNKLGFKKISETAPNYWYIVNRKKYHRFNFRKNVLKDKLEIFDKNLTEWQNMQINGYDRLWDCGNFKYELEI